MKKYILFTTIILLFFISCNEPSTKQVDNLQVNDEIIIEKLKLDIDLVSLSENQKSMLKLFIKASEFIDSMFFYENFSDYQIVLDTLKDKKKLAKFIYNFGPWDIFNKDEAFLDNVGEKPLGANFYPHDITKKEFEDFKDNNKNSPYTFIRRDENNNLYCVAYHKEFKKYIKEISKLLDSAAELSENEEFANYLQERAIALQTDEYLKSDTMWLNLRENMLDFIIGPVYLTSDKFMHIKMEHQAFILLKDNSWSKKMAKYNSWLKYLQKAIPVPEKYRAEDPGENSSIDVYDVLYIGGSGKVSGVFISMLFPMNTDIQINHGVKNLLFRNIIDYKFYSIVKPLSNIVFVDYQKPFITSDALFVKALLFEMANSLGIRNTVDGKGTVRKALKGDYFISSYLKNMSLSLFLAEKLFEVGELKSGVKEVYFTLVINLLRLIRYGELNSYAISNLVFYNYLVDEKAISYNDNQKIVIDYKKMKEANNELIKEIIIMQGDGDAKRVSEFIEKYNFIDAQLLQIIERINKNNIPTDIQFIEGENILKF
ncbi:MAG: hypothetical protein U9Q83_11450 [Bacteroidota bacterium]|nr:hypothetical protein [Bacteroidota bacterium]